MESVASGKNIVCDQAQLITQCRVCDAPNLELALDLGFQPWGNHFLKKEEVGTEPFYPLRVVFCGTCRTPQLDYTVPKETMFADHTYLSGTTKSLGEHFKSVAVEADRMFFRDAEKKSVLDIGSNDGTQLKHFKDLGYDVFGVESSKTAAVIANTSGVPTLHAFFNLETAKKIDRKFDIINAAGVFFHLEELHSFTDGVREVLAENGVFVVQFLYMKRIVENDAFDQIYHEHLLYYNLKNVETLLNRHGLALFDARVSPIHGGSVIAYATHKGKRSPSSELIALITEEDAHKSNELATYREFAKRIEIMKEKNLQYLTEARTHGKRVFGMGAPVKGNTLMNYFGINENHLECLVEKNELRRGLYSPGSHLVIRIEKELTELPDIYYVLAWNFKKEILANNQELIEKGVEFYFPVNPKEI
ncbi:MAG: class I SAM-dependent methyltransferase, partial [Candidatus Pacebacteria bacterium]|nr:class I SAM-dependent methyltransferase [Candidatus Paceibacterota bacterium]